MTLEFQKLTDQVDRMGDYVSTHEETTENKLDIALQIMQAFSDPAWLPEIDRRVMDAVRKDAGYRGARPIDEPIMSAHDPAPLPPSATVIGTDGSQIFPDQHAPVQYFCINTGTIAIHHGSGEPPIIATEPYLFFEQPFLFNPDGTAVATTAVSARRTVYEMAALAENTWKQRAAPRPHISMLDGPLLFVMSNEVPEREQLRRNYFSAMTRLMEVNAALVGYIDRPRSRFVVGMLHLLDLPEDQVTRRSLGTDGRIEGVRDLAIFRTFLQPGQRSAIFIQMSPTNKEFRNDGGEMLEVAFFYMNLAHSSSEQPVIARVEMPMWVAHNRQLVSETQALIYHQCQQTVTRYPYALARADELAVVKREESRQLDIMIQVSLMRHGIVARQSAKQEGKDMARGYKSRHHLGGNGPG